MKRVIAIICTVACLVACAPSPDKVARKAIEEVVLQYLDCPSTYSFVSLKYDYDNTLESEFNYAAGDAQMYIEFKERDINSTKEMIRMFSNWPKLVADDKVKLKKLEKELDYLHDVAAKIDSLKAEIGDSINTVVSKEYSMEYDAQNINGAMVRHTLRAAVLEDGSLRDIYDYKEHFNRTYKRYTYQPLAELVSDLDCYLLSYVSAE